MRANISSLVFTAFVVVTAAACEQPPVISEGEGEGEGEGEEGCLQATLGPVTFNFQDDVSTHYQAEITSALDGEAPDFLVLQFFNYNERIGSLGAGTFPLDDETNDNYGHCAECLLVLTDQLTPTSAPARTFFQSGGTMELEKNPREGIDLFGVIRDLVLVESTIGGDALESAPVPGGDCLELGDVELAVKFVDQGWTCAAEAYNAGDGVCDCDCTVTDPDCFPNFDAPPPTSTTGCVEDEVCTVFGCRVACDAFAGEGCADPTNVCTFAEPVDFCEDQSVIDGAPVGAACGSDSNRFWCAVEDTIPFGVCEFDFDGDEVRLCRPRCAADADCEEGEGCVEVAFAQDGTGRGYCAPEEG